MKTEIQKSFKRLAVGSRKGPTQFSERYFQELITLDNHIRNTDSLKVLLAAGDVSSCERLLRFALVFNDITVCVLPTTGPGARIRYMKNEWFIEKFGAPATLTLKKAQLEKIDPNGGFMTGYMVPTGQPTAKFLLDVAPLIRDGRLVVQPKRLVLARSKEQGVQWHAMGSAPFTSLQEWDARPRNDSSPIPLEYVTTSGKDDSKLMEIVMPFIDGVPFKILSKILLDEELLLSQLRSSIKTAAEEAKKAKSPNEVIQDVVRPNVDAVGKKFASIRRLHSIRGAGATLGTMTLALSAISTGGLAVVPAVAAGGVLTKVYTDYLKDLDALRHDPYYFLWKCRELRKRR